MTNAVQCHCCLEVIESLHRHDFKFCRCGDVAVDGGRDYNRRAFNTGATWDELTTQEEQDQAINNTPGGYK